MLRGISFSAVFGAIALLSTTLSAPPALADVGQYVRTQSGKVQCVLYADYPGTDPRYRGDINLPAGPLVMCEATSFDGFRQAGHSLAIYDGSGNFSFQCCANIGGSVPINFLTMAYGQSYNIQGWTVAASESGTRFTNNSTGHGMFVSIENVYAF